MFCIVKEISLCNNSVIHVNADEILSPFHITSSLAFMMKFNRNSDSVA
jgi:hypothetical protein